jgi:hypothetical protein
LPDFLSKIHADFLCKENHSILSHKPANFLTLHKCVFLVGGDAALYWEEARDPGQVRQGGAQHHEAGEWRPTPRQPGPTRRRTHVLAPSGALLLQRSELLPRGPLATGGRLPGNLGRPGVELMFSPSGALLLQRSELIPRGPFATGGRFQ